MTPPNLEASTPPRGLAEGGEARPSCRNPDCDAYPYYGVAPHECFYKKGPTFRFGQSTLLDQRQWPANFVLDLEPGEDPATVEYPSACGVYYCPACLAGHPSPSHPGAIDPPAGTPTLEGK